jgi:uncharacterized protein (TIGR01777 family)
MKVLITGGTGFIGKKIIKALHDKNHEMVVLTRNSISAAFHIPVHCEIHEWNPEVNAISPDILNGVDAVINLAGENIANGRWTTTQKHKILQSRIMSVRRLVEAMSYLDQKPEAFVSASAIGFYGNRENEILDEKSSAGDGFLSGVCQGWEKEIFTAKSLGVRTVAYRLGMVLGHDGGALNKMLPPFRFGLGGQLGNGMQWASWIHIDDLVNMLVQGIEKPSLKGIYNAVAPRPIQNKNFTKVLGAVVKRPTIIPVPGFALKMGLGELSDLLLDSQNVSAQKIIETGFKFQYPELQDALKEVCGHSYHELKMEQWIPQPIDEAFAFFKEAKNLEKITPDEMNFKVLNQSTENIQEGTIINYSLSVHKFPMRWKSKITNWKPGSHFSDIQLNGPYDHWVHRHEFEEKNGGTLIKDHVRYKVPIGLAGDLIANRFIKNDLEKVFTYRQKKINELFNENKNKETESHV